MQEGRSRSSGAARCMISLGDPDPEEAPAAPPPDLPSLSAAQGRSEALLRNIFESQREATASLAEVRQQLGALLAQMQEHARVPRGSDKSSGITLGGEADQQIAASELAQAAAGRDRGTRRGKTNFLQSATAEWGGRSDGGRRQDISSAEVAPRVSRVQTSMSVAATSVRASTSITAKALPSGWPRGVKPRSFANMPELQEPIMDQTLSKFMDTASEHPILDAVQAQVGRQYPLADPGSSANGCLAVASCVVMLHDLSVMPVVLAWGLAFEGYIRQAALVSASFWTVDLLSSFFKGYYKKGHLVSSPRETARHYVGSWLLPDLLMVCCDWCGLLMEMALESKGQSALGLKVMRFAKLSRLFRIAGAFRLLRVMARIQELLHRLVSDTGRVVLSMAGWGVGTIWFAHVQACVWFAIGSSVAESGALGWAGTVVTFEHQDVYLLDTPVEYQYLTSLHWSISTVCLGGTEINPSNSEERLATVVCLACGLLIGSVLISLMSSGMVELHSRGRATAEKLRGLRHFLMDNPVHTSLAFRVMTQARVGLRGSSHFMDSCAPALEALSTSLRVELQSEVCQRHLVSHALFRCWASLGPQWFARFCYEAVELKYLKPSETLFMAGSPGVAAYLLIRGSMQYSAASGYVPVGEEATEELKEGAWLAESALWSQWMHVGTAEATTNVKVVVVDALSLPHVVERHHEIAALAAEYCKAFHERIVLGWVRPTDIRVAGTDFSALVYSMSCAASALISMHAIAQSCKTHHTYGHHLARSTYRARGMEEARRTLAEEVENGRSVVVLDSKGHLERRVEVIALHIENDDGSVFVKLGKWDSDTRRASVSCELPGGKRIQHESTEEATDRIIQSKLEPLMDQITVTRTQSQEFERYAQQFQVNTKYCRTVCFSTFDGTVDCPICTVNMLANRRSTCVASVSDGEDITTSTQMQHADPFRYFKADWILTKYQQRAVYFINGAFYTWASPDEMKHFQTSTGQVEVKNWLGSLLLPNQREVSMESPSPRWNRQTTWGGVDHASSEHSI